ncbi:glycoside hydrolase family 92 protein [Labilibacter sediminis]|nr:glycoside hydrolase family 92 protein [Labilibacter sediminis]
MKYINYKSKFLAAAVVGCLMLISCTKNTVKKRPVDYVNPMIGAFAPAGSDLKGRDCGRTFPGPAAPFGLVQLSPDTHTGDDTGNGYSYFNNTIEGFSFTHMSGIGWFGDLGNFLVMPTTGPLKTAKGTEETPEEGYRSRFSHESEKVKAGYYGVKLEDYNIDVELTATERAGMLRFTFPEHDQSRIQIDLARRIGGTSTEQYVKVEDEYTISGWMKCPPEGGGWGNGKGKGDYTVYFWCEFDKPIKNVGVWSADIPDDWDRRSFSRVPNENGKGHNKWTVTKEVFGEKYQQRIAEAKIIHDVKEMQGKHLGFFTEFPTKAGEQVMMKSGISFVNLEGAKENLENDIAHWNFDRVVKETSDKWNTELSKMTVKGSTEDHKIKFYTALYRTMIDPRSSSDVNGNYIGADTEVHQADGFVYRTIFSGWDVFRSQFPLQTIINPEIVNDEINSFIQMAELSGRKYYPRWEFLNSYSGCMVGNPAVPVVVDAYEKGIRNYNIEKAFEYAKNSVDTFGNGELGYVPNDLSETLEYAYSEWCVGKMAESLDKKDLAEKYYNLGQSYKNVWNEENGWFQSRISETEWRKWKGRLTHFQGTIESNPYQQGWFVPHDVEGFITFLGEERFNEEILNFFDKTPDGFLWNDYYNHSNEPVHHVPFMLNYSTKPYLTQKWTRKICDEAYGTDVLGLIGNEDVGQMSAWYILASMGIHPICPGNNQYELTSPVFDEVEVTLDPNYYTGKTFKVIAHNNSEENIYIQSVKLNGNVIDRTWITHKEIVNGGVLEFEMGSEPNITWGI